jgi:predicted TIM-barrel fold metal-dependent hydrolase
MLARPLAALDDAEGAAVPAGLPPVVDAHVHVFPERVFESLWAWFEQHGWPIRYRLRAEAVIDFLLGRGIDHLVLLHYAHKGGMARALNRFVAELCADRPRVTGLATVMPGEPGAADVLEEAFALGLKGVKLHCHVQCFAPDDPALDEVYAACARHGRPLVMHAGREPKSPAYRCDPHALCSAARVERVLQRFPDLRLCVPHLGADEYEPYRRLIERYDNLWLDTTMLLAGYFPGEAPWSLVEARPERILYGTDFPNLPYAWDRELRLIVGRGLSAEARARHRGLGPGAVVGRSRASWVGARASSSGFRREGQPPRQAWTCCMHMPWMACCWHCWLGAMPHWATMHCTMAWYPIWASAVPLVRHCWPQAWGSCWRAQPLMHCTVWLQLASPCRQPKYCSPQCSVMHWAWAC